MTQHQLGLLAFGARCSTLHFAFAQVVRFPLFVHFSLQICNLAIAFGLYRLELLLKTFIQFSLFLKPLIESVLFGHLIAWSQLKPFVKVRLFSFKSLDFLWQFTSIALGSLGLFLEALRILLLNLLQHLIVVQLCAALVIEVHFLLQFQRLLELFLQLFQILLRLVSLRFEETESAFPKSALFVQQILLFLQICLRILQLTP